MIGYKKANPNPLESLLHGWQIILPTMLVSILLSQTAFAQSPVPHIKKKYDNNNEYVPTELKQPPDLPFLPPYPQGANYNNILSFNRVPDKPCFTLTFHVKEPPEDVIAFYKDAFKSNKWSPQVSVDSTKQAAGRRSGASATVLVMKPIMKGYKTQVYMVYKIYGKVK